MIYVLADNDMEAEQLIREFQDGAMTSIHWKWVRNYETLQGADNITVIEAAGWRTRARMRDRLIWAQEIITLLRTRRIRLWLSEHNHRLPG